MTQKIVAEFKCKECGNKTETVRLLPRGAAGNYCSGDAIKYNFDSETMMLSPEEAAIVGAALAAADAAAVHAAHPRWLASYCPKCGACYCRKHWKIEQWPDPASDSYSMHYDTFGTCPLKHRRLMAKDGMGWPDETKDAGPIILHGK